jgi:DNA mismatch endonuclease (patch repair protein)
MINRWPTDPATSARMKLVRRTATGPEQRVQDALREIGVRFTTALRSVAGTPDLGSRKYRWAIFVHGCFWHGHARCPYATVPRRNRMAWFAKIEGNKARDRSVMHTLRSKGFVTLVIWECQTHDAKRIRQRLMTFFSSKEQNASRRHRSPIERPAGSEHLPKRAGKD